MRKILGLMTLLTMFGASGFASEYPADMEMKSTCQQQGPVKVCRGLQYGGQAVLNIYYTGRLMKEPGLKAFVQVNYQDGKRQAIFAMRPSNPPPYDSQAFVRITGGCLVGELGGCKTSGTAEMRYLLFWAQRMGGWTLNALNFEVAFVSDSKEAGWDNNGGFAANYRFSFPQD